MEYFEVSAKTDDSVNQAFLSIARKLMAKKDPIKCNRFYLLKFKRPLFHRNNQDQIATHLHQEPTPLNKIIKKGQV
jgi:hypothetical protein